MLQKSDATALAMSDVAADGLSPALRERVAHLQSQALLAKWGLTTLRRLSWTSPERFGRLLDLEPLGDEGLLAELRELQMELWESRQESRRALPSEPLKVLQSAAGLVGKKEKLAADLVNEQATRIDLEAREAAKGMLGESGRLLRDKMKSHFEAATEHGFTMMLSHLPYENLIAAYEQAHEEPWYRSLTRDVLNTALLRRGFGWM